MRSKVDPEKKEQALKAIEAGTPVKEIAAQTGIPQTTISNWKSDLKKKNSGAAGGKKKRKANGASIEQRLVDSQWSLSLEQLENRALRKMVNEPNADKWPVIEIIYLRERLGLFGDKWVKPLGEMLKDPAEEQ